MTRKERLEGEAAEVRKEARELREALHASYRHKESWSRRINNFIENMLWWQWSLLGFIGGWSLCALMIALLP